MLYKDWGQQKLSRFSKRNGKLPLPRQKQDNYPVITIYALGTVAMMTYLVLQGVPMRSQRSPIRTSRYGTLEHIVYEVPSLESNGETPATTYPRAHATIDVCWVFTAD